MSSLTINSIPPATQSALQGIQRGMSGLNRDAQAVAGAGVAGDVDVMTSALVDSIQQKVMVEASATMLSTTDRTLGSLLDIKA